MGKNRKSRTNHSIYCVTFPKITVALDSQWKQEHTPKQKKKKFEDKNVHVNFYEMDFFRCLS